MSPNLPILLTCGEPAGIGPELAAKAAGCGVPFVYLGDPSHLPVGTDWQEVNLPSDAVAAGKLAVLRHEFPAPNTHGFPNPDNSQAVIDVIARAVELVQLGQASAICTLPINKEALKSGAGFAFPGHTEFLAHLAGTEDVVMMLASTSVTPPCRVVPATIHIALEDVPAAFTPDLLSRVIKVTAAALRRDFAIVRPRIAIAGLNPHAGENGVMGRQEGDWMRQLIRDMSCDAFQLSGPHPADTMFHPSARAKYDAAICAYHDQALIPIKTLDFAGGVNVTLGLPFIRTSPDHGTAFDIAGQGVADPSSVIAALKMAQSMAAQR